MISNRVQITEYTFQKLDTEQENKKKGSSEAGEIPVPPTEDIPAPIEEPVEPEKPTNPIIDEEKDREKMIV